MNDRRIMTYGSATVHILDFGFVIYHINLGLAHPSIPSINWTLGLDMVWHGMALDTGLYPETDHGERHARQNDTLGFSGYTYRNVFQMRINHHKRQSYLDNNGTVIFSPLPSAPHTKLGCHL